MKKREVRWYTVIVNNDGELHTHRVLSCAPIKEIADNEYYKLLNTYEDLDECQLDEWKEEEHANADKGSHIDLTGEPIMVQMGATIDYCMGHEYIYDISIKVEVEAA